MDEEIRHLFDVLHELDEFNAAAKSPDSKFLASKLMQVTSTMRVIATALRDRLAYEQEQRERS